MPNPKFTIAVTADDKATAVLRRIGETLNRLHMPGAQKRDQDGLKDTQKALTEVRNAAGDAADKLRGILPPLSALTSAASLAGIAGLAARWADAGGALARIARTAGVSTDEMQSLGGAAKLAGLDADRLKGGLAGLGLTIHDAIYGRNKEALELFNKLGIHLRDAKGNARGAADVFRDLGDAIAARPGAERTIAGALGLEEMLPLLRRGRGGIAALEREVRRLGGVMDHDAVDSAEGFEESLNKLGIAVGAVANRIGADYSGALKSATDALTEFLATHQRGAAELAQIGAGAGTAIGLAALSRVPLVGAALGAAGLGTATAAGIGVATAAGATAAALAEGNRGLDPYTSLDPEGGLVIMPPPAPRGPQSSVFMPLEPPPSRATVDIVLHGAPPGTQARVRSGGSAGVTLRVEHSLPSGVTPP